jgi:hypothetical protein
MASVNAINTRTDLTVQIFDRFYGYEQQVPVEAYDAVLSYFKSVFESAEAAGNFTVSLFRVSQQSGIPVMNLLQQFQGQTAPQINLTLAYYLNGVRSSSTLLGVNTPTQTNFYVSRNIRT